MPDTHATVERPANAVAARAEAAYLGLALGDALGATVEFMTPREIQAQHGCHRTIRGGGWLKLKPGAVTDDTTMALALGNAILAAGDIDAHAIGEAFDAWMRAKPVDIGNTVRRGIIEFRRTGRLAAPPSEHDAGNGACMRVLPVALATLGQPEDAVRTACRVQAHLTHHNPLSDAGTETIALMIQDALQGADLDALVHQRLLPLIDAFPIFDPDGKREENPSGFIKDTLRAVFQALLDTDSFETCLIDVVNRGGDADTTGAIAGMLAGALYGPASLPEPWLASLDHGTRRACAIQSQALLAQACGNTTPTL
ncbi:ADP-ribosyl-[dinitrogen reductase] hydrolase [Zoogloea sp. LCSB751]|uniref:ADP-ribosyl-[dinitrogen reductase] hydrolase n=1 Tax=Zoogloea sp. LCSB751 TaxID=1965277 RepID=UPI0009A4DC8D|nr:ADP-ribosyl-[dinitrogen reductase] hydrolase [Zoogloea sp. LCSB751]